MPFNYNHVTVAGNLTRDPELRSTTNSQVANFSIAINRRYRVGEEQREETTFIDCEAWGRTAELIGQYLHKGSPAFVEGRLKLDTWEDKDGKRQSRIRIFTTNIQFLPGNQGGGGAGQRQTDQRPQPVGAGVREADTAYTSPAELGDDEPPF